MKVEKRLKTPCYGLKGGMGIGWLIYVPFGGRTHKSVLKQYQPN
jgi:hypothetical protein